MRKTTTQLSRQHLLNGKRYKKKDGERENACSLGMTKGTTSS